MNPFRIFGLPLRFGLNPEALAVAHRELSKALHPDRHGHAPSAARRRVLDQAISANDAYRLLRDPLERAAWLLAHAKEASGYAQPDAERSNDPALLMQVLDLREALSGAKAHGDLQNVRALAARGRALLEGELEALRVSLEEGPIAECLREASLPVGQETRQTEASPELEVALSRASSLLGRARYFRRFVEEAAAIEDELD